MLEIETTDVSDEELEKARQRGEALWQWEPRARRAKYEKRSGRVRIDLTNGSTFWFPTGIVEGLEGATPEQLAKITLAGEGYALHWEELDFGIPVPAMLAGRFGTKKHMAALVTG